MDFIMMLLSLEHFLRLDDLRFISKDLSESDSFWYPYTEGLSSIVEVHASPGGIDYNFTFNVFYFLGKLLWNQSFPGLGIYNS